MVLPSYSIKKPEQTTVDLIRNTAIEIG